MTEDTEIGSAQISVYLADVDEEQIETLMTDFADVLRKHGLAVSDDNDALHAIVAVRPFLWPEDTDDFLHGHLADVTTFVIPTAEGYEIDNDEDEEE